MEPPASRPRRLHLRIHGLVQGVYFRVYTRDAARRLGLSGWVRNREDGSVEALAEGDESALKELAAWCRQGSPGSAVDRVEEQWGEPTGELAGFSVRY